MIFFGAVLLAGCTTRLSQKQPRVADWQQDLPTPASVPESPAPAAATSRVTNISSQASPFSVPTNETWVSFNRWCQANGIGSPVMMSSSPVLTYSLSTTNGSFVFRPGSRVGHWEGKELRLGFAPVMIDRQPFVHTLDLAKTIVPLVENKSPFASASVPVLVLDPGHGGEDAGAKSAVEMSWEKEYTLDWARRVQALLLAKGWQVFLTRSNDSEIALSNRVSFAVQHHAEIFLSLHFNSAGTNRDQTGLETYCLTPSGMPSTITRGYPDDTTATFPNNAFDSQNLQLSMHLHHSLLVSTGRADRGVRHARFLSVLRGQQCPAVLIEGGYLSNPAEARLIGQGNYRQKLAEGVVRGLLGACEVRKPQTNGSGAGNLSQVLN